MKGVLSYYYKTDAEVSQDPELQKWIQDIFEHGFLSQACTGVLKNKLMFYYSESPYLMLPSLCIIHLLDRRLLLLGLNILILAVLVNSQESLKVFALWLSWSSLSPW